MKTFTFLLTLFLFASCGIGGAKGPLNFSVNMEQPVRAEDVNFGVLQKRVLPKCIGCHKDWTNEETVNRFTKENHPDESRLFVSVLKGEMPKQSRPLNSEQLEIVRNYVANIRYTRPVETALPDDGKPVAFDVVKEKVFQVSCLPCHSGRLKDEDSLVNGGKKRWIDRQNLDNSSLLTVVVTGKMPKQRNLLTDNQIELIRRYLRNFR